MEAAEYLKAADVRRSGDPEAGELLENRIEEGAAPLFEPSVGLAAMNRSLKKNLRRFWAQHSKSFRRSWTELGLERKRNLLEACVARVPDPLADRLHLGNLSEGSLLLTPEMNIHDLVSTGERSVIALYEKWCSSEMDEDLAHAREMVRSLLNKETIPTLYPKVFILLADLAKHEAGKWIECQTPGSVGAFHMLEKGGCAIQKDVYELAHGRINFVLATLALCADTYRAERVGLDNFLVASPTVGCSACGRTETPEGRELVGCRDCMKTSMVMFCSKVSTSKILQSFTIFTSPQVHAKSV